MREAKLTKLNINDVDAVREFLLSFDAFAGAPQEGMNYVNEALRRFLITLSMLPRTGESGQRLLELGASPYFLTALLRDQTQLQVELANYFGDSFPAEAVQVVRSKRFGKHYEFRYRNCNVERDRLPYDDGTFSGVLCCEIIEHLAMDPTYMLCEIHRVLAPGGYLLLTTPNVLGLRNLMDLFRRRNIFHPYSGYGVYGRHQREYTLDELKDLIAGCGYEISDARVEDLHVYPLWQRWFSRLRPMRREHLFILARSAASPRFYYPPWLYTSTHAIHRVVSPDIRMGWNDVGHLGLGWWGLENLGPPLRWTEREAHIHLLLPAGAIAVEAYVCAGPAALGSVNFSLGVVGVDREQSVALEPDKWRAVSVPLPQTLDDQVEVILRVDETRNPTACGLSADGRDLGVMVRRVAAVSGDGRA